MPEPAVEISGLTKRYGELRAVDGLTLTLAAGQMMALVGPDGAGKTTLIRTLCGILPPDAGTVRLFGQDIVSGLARVKPMIGYLSQKFSMYGDLTVDENIEFFAEIHGVRDFAARRDQLLEFTRLTAFRGRLAERLSGGMKQKLALACTLVHTPRIIFLDEPTTGVDPVSRRDFWKILSGLLKTGLTIMLTTPYMDEAERCSLVGMMDRGRLLACAPPAAIKQRMAAGVVELVCGDARAASRALAQLPEVKEVQTFGDRLNIILDDVGRDWPAVQRHLDRTGIASDKWREIAPSLENVFVSLMQGQKRENV
ncbi:MAG TPA: ABC transporter ATP-binding protein [Candidatus Edwardsbacteria bacterium]|nr:ABC transporter ATP-binding protein [Candidatus Edwardsbacteria bacterium]